MLEKAGQEEVTAKNFLWELGKIFIGGFLVALGLGLIGVVGMILIQSCVRGN